MPADQTIDKVLLIISLGMLTLGLGSMLLGWLVKQWDRFVNRSVVVMSRSEDDRSDSAASSLRTDAGRTPDGRIPAKRKAEEFFTLCQLMRAYGIKRDEALAAFKASDIPFSSDLWRDAAPPEPEQVTPIAGRPTGAEFPEDRGLLYEAPPR